MKKGPDQVTTTSLDPQSQKYVNEMRTRAMEMSKTPFEGYGGNFSNPAAAGYAPYTEAGQLGIGALSGNAEAAGKFMNPYFATMNPLFDQMRAQNLNAADSRATQAGAFGGSRTGIVEGQALGDVSNLQAQFGYQGFNDAMQRAGQAANLGFGANQSLAGMGSQQQMMQYAEFLRKQGFPDVQINRMLGGMGPTGTETRTPTQSNLLGTIGGLAGMAFGGPVGGAVGGWLGGQFGGPTDVSGNQSA